MYNRKGWVPAGCMLYRRRYSNEEVATELLARGLKWCDGIVFLDDADKQQAMSHTCAHAHVHTRAHAHVRALTR